MKPAKILGLLLLFMAASTASARLRLRAIPAEIVYQPAESEIVLERPWTNFIVTLN